tara:strand:+ start:486 stop:1106 length:621 start_codon:yes stop_codon:yes gene_type:complete
MKKFQKHIGLAAIILINVVGVIGYSSESLFSFFKMMTPYSLLFTLILCFLYLQVKKFIPLFIILFTIGFGVEFLGVKTGLLFGSYSYGPTLGIQYLNVPLIIGVNWFILSVGARGCANWLTQNTFLQILCSALLMVGLDFLIEPVAMKYDFWNWFQNKVPPQNYLMWLLVSILMQVILTKKSSLIPSKLGFAIFSSQLIFFGILLL